MNWCGSSLIVAFLRFPPGGSDYGAGFGDAAVPGRAVVGGLVGQGVAQFVDQQLQLFGASEGRVEGGGGDAVIGGVESDDGVLGHTGAVGQGGGLGGFDEFDVGVQPAVGGLLLGPGGEGVVPGQFFRRTSMSHWAAMG